MKFLILFLPLFSYSKILYQPLQSTRSLGMGGTSISFVRGVDALYLNSAALARMEGYSFTLAEAQAAYGKNSDRLLEFRSDTSGNLLLSDLDKLYNQTFFADASVKSGMVFPYFGFGIYSANYIHETFRDSSALTFKTDFVSDKGYEISGAIPLGQNVSFGVSGRYIERWGGENELSVLSLIGSNDRKLIEALAPNKGKGLALDLSFLATFPGVLNPSIAFVWKDLGGTKFTPTQGLGPNSQDDNLIFGASIQHPFAYGSWTHALEYKFIRTNSEDFTKKYHLGTEVSFGIIDLRAGIYQGHVTYGAAFDISFIRVEAASYALELGDKTGDNRSDRFQGSVSINLDFDQAFKLSKDSKKRRLMQRR